jgi:hypothetical protein
VGLDWLRAIIVPQGLLQVSEHRSRLHPPSDSGEHRIKDQLSMHGARRCFDPFAPAGAKTEESGGLWSRDAEPSLTL